MTPQAVCQVVLTIGLLMSAAGGFGSFQFGKKEERDNRERSNETQRELNSQIAKLQASFDAKTDLIFQAMNVKPDVWTSVQMDNVPPGVTDYLLLLFKSDRGRISGKVRVHGSENTAFFSTTSNDTIPVAVPNLWLPAERHYKNANGGRICYHRKNRFGRQAERFYPRLDRQPRSRASLKQNDPRCLIC